ncbi:hypothetical protein [Lactiplantibacillus mudanjiangensis]|uniref:Uncharacterized protein n=1 Tax=Lactiplantibacillus mudanjiangensis TaxID=1296538 RepID=A0A660DXY0_9LACO|nr:hypothetical protein [Lactiplantibacillus mudanjiangensis]VDG26007.1 hypothetical protein MUDAN_IGPPGNFN_03534 [Lactiplantibacillus mudanjiangensis]VDG27895.1 hypothetical protein MUDAN_MDHGFNIF_02712 [Lactiplantibacillus mudanjiangensis]
MSGRKTLTDLVPKVVKKRIVDKVLPKYPKTELAAEITSEEVVEALSTFEDEAVLYNMTEDDDWLLFYCWLCASYFHEDLMIRFIREKTGEPEPVVEEPVAENQELVDELRGIL